MKGKNVLKIGKIRKKKEKNSSANWEKQYSSFPTDRVTVICLRSGPFWDRRTKSQNLPDVLGKT